MGSVLRKPTWMTAETYQLLMERCGGIPRCVVSGETADLSFDHIVPTHHGGTDDASNLEIKAGRLNSSKGARPDPYWRRKFYFDQLPVLQNCRAAQRGIYNELWAQRDWFGEPTSNIARLLYTFPMVVGSGKTLAIPVAACAYNAIMRARWGDCRRADRILVLTKERAIRDQLATDLKEDTGQDGYGLFLEPPNVYKVTAGWQLRNSAVWETHHIVVSCIQQLWDDDCDLLSLLHKFPVIFIDEPHWAAERVVRIVEAAKTSVCLVAPGRRSMVLATCCPG